MRRLAMVTLVVFASGCDSATQQVGDLDVTVAAGGRLRSDQVTVVVGPNTLPADQTFAITRTESQIPRALSPLFRIEPGNIAISQPVAVSIPIVSGQPARVQVAVVDEAGAVVSTQDAQIDPITGEARASLPQLGAFVLIEASETTDTFELQDDPSEAQMTDDFFTGAVASHTLNDFSFVGDWEGSGEYAGLDMTFDSDRFTVRQGPELVREGSYTASDGLVTLTDLSGSIESGSYTVDQLGERLVLNLASDQLTWYRPGAQPAPVENQAEQSVAQDDATDATQQTIASATPAGGDSAINTPATQKKQQGLFGRISSGIKKFGQKTVESAKNVGRGIGGQFKRDVESSTQKAASTVDPSILGEERASGDGRDVAQHPLFTTPLAGTTPALPQGHACLVGRDTLQSMLGFSLIEPRSIPASEKGTHKQSICDYLNLEGHGSIRVTFYWRTYGAQVPKTWSKQLKDYSDRYGRVAGVGDDARWAFYQSNPARLEVEILMGNSILSVERKGGNSYIRNLSSADAPQIIEIAKLAASSLMRQ